MPEEREIRRAFYGYYRSVKRHGWLKAAELATASADPPAGPFSKAELLAWCLVARLFEPGRRAEALWFVAAQSLKELQEGRV
jgi:hypothetical protein